MIKSASFEIAPMGDAAVIVRFGESIDPTIHSQVRALSDAVSARPVAGSIEIVPGYTTLTVYYDPLQRSFQDICDDLEQLAATLEAEAGIEARIVDIPVHYGGESGPDLPFVAGHNSLSTDDVIQIHSSAQYLVYMIGFAPGFPYLGGMSSRIAAPRRQSPRLKIPAGSVGIAGHQTGVYPIETPGGWQLIGRTPLELFTPRQSPPSHLRAGDVVRFQPITTSEFERLRMTPP